MGRFDLVDSIMLANHKRGNTNNAVYFIGRSVRYCQGLYFTLKDEVFNGPRPYNSEPLERFLRQHLGENTYMTAVTHPKYNINL